MNITKLVFLILLFFVVANPITYKYVNKGLSYVGLKGIIYDGGSVSQCGVLIHAIVFYFIYTCLSDKGYIEGFLDDADQNEKKLTDLLKQKNKEKKQVDATATSTRAVKKAAAEASAKSEKGTAIRPKKIKMPELIPNFIEDEFDESDEIMFRIRNIRSIIGTKNTYTDEIKDELASIEDALMNRPQEYERNYEPIRELEDEPIRELEDEPRRAPETRLGPAPAEKFESDSIPSAY